MIKHVLFLDDCTADLIIIKRHAEATGFGKTFKVDYVSSPMDLITIVNNLTIDVISMDMFMGVNGLSLAKSVKKINSDIKIGFLSGITCGNDYDEARKIGEFVISKDEIDKVMIAIEKLL